MIDPQKHPTTHDNNELPSPLFSPSIFQLDHESSSSCVEREWPNLYDETYDMILASIMVYGLVDLRTLARNGTLVSSGSTDGCAADVSTQPPTTPATSSSTTTRTGSTIVQKLLELPISADEILKLVQQNRQQIEDEIGPESTQLYLTTFDNLTASSSSSKGGSPSSYSYRHDDNTSGSPIIHSSDQSQVDAATSTPPPTQMRAAPAKKKKDLLSDHNINNTFREGLLENDHHCDVESQQRQQRQVQQELQRDEVVLVDPTSSAALHIVAVDDNNATEELVYGICVNTAKGYITVIFRGATTTKDWKVCGDPLMIQQSLELPTTTSTACTTSTTSSHPHHDYYCGGGIVDSCGGIVGVSDNDDETRDTQTHVVSIHRGFYNYLFSRLHHNHGDQEEEEQAATTTTTDPTTNTTSATNTKHTVCNNNNKFECICDHLERLLQIYPNYKVYITGHSLGGALATVCAFELAVKWSKSLSPPPSMSALLAASMPSSSSTSRRHKRVVVTCIPFGNPMVGNLQFQQVFETLEELGILRCIRVTNYFDIFTQLPDRGSYFLYTFMLYWGCAMGPFFILYYIVWSLVFLVFCQHRVYRHVGMDLHLYNVKDKKNKKNGADDEDVHDDYAADDDAEVQFHNNQDRGFGDGMQQNLQNFFKIKRSDQFSSRNVFAKRLLSDWKRLWKQTIQRMIAIPCSYTCAWCDYFDVFNWKQDFHINHGAKEHLRRLSIMKDELSTLYLNDLYKQRRQQQQQGQQHPQQPPVDLTEHPTATRRSSKRNSYTIESRHDGVTLQLVPMMSST